MSTPHSNTATPVVELDHVTVRYGAGNNTVLALNDVSLSVPRSRFLTILGPSGCGKSTLLNLVAGFALPTEGSVKVEGQEVIGPSARKGVVFQDSSALFPWLSVARNIEFGLKANGVPKDERLARAAAALELVGLTAFANRYPRELSGGMRQLTAIARALVLEPPVLLMDEPFAALDAMTRERMQAQLIEIWVRTGLTIIFITHSVDEAIYLGDEVLVMSPRPGTVKARLPIDLDRPRVTTSAAFNALKLEAIENLQFTPGKADLE
ncbi:MAG TPA: ABC transporter ATP-binding protein [Devosia sp.]|nr:ABC transporter ATP-binding protein [Devosia sp.]